MSTIDRRTSTIERVEFVVPAKEPYGANWTEVYGAIRMAWQELENDGFVKPGREPADNQIQVLANDEAVIVYYERSTTNSDNEK